MKTGIKGRLVWSYLILIVLTVVMFETLILSALRFYYIEGVQQTLRDQGTMFISFHEQELKDGLLEEKAPLFLQQYNFLISAQVQLLNHHGKLVADSHNNAQSDVGQLDDVKAALTGQTGYFTGRVNDEKVMTVTQPMMIEGNNYGAIRLTTSMEQINHVLFQNMLILMAIGLFVIVIAALISYFLANTITKPVSAITSAAEKMASGKFSTRIAKQKNDELGKLTDTLNFMAEEVEKHEQMKNEFIASVSHELRTPLTSVKGWAITLHTMSTDETFQEGLQIISNESERLSNMLGDLLDLSSLSAGKVKYNFEELSLKETLQQVVSQLNPRACRQGVELIPAFVEDAFIKGDAGRLKQVFINIIDNALKFTPSGGEIIISLEIGQFKTAEIHITDTGEGISNEDLPLIKEKFQKGKSKASGTGLGLAICQEIIHAHNGTFELKSKVGKGTTVEITLPIN
ncbi:HAMP domain-containing sensor histidine kinase [Bacillus sp. JJ1609]|uniref:sensor histidine kinase n=1 Tax=Bacillus sp. JJ1609 TaxID=3122977 RepID=UPI002FFEBC0B